ncbi:MAG: ROK family protein [Dehalococcoidia bacterium]
MVATVVAADVGGTHLRAAVVDATGHVFARRERPTPKLASGDEILAILGDLLAMVARAAAVPPSAVCVAAPGLINAVAGSVILAPNIPGFRNLQLAAPLSARVGVPVVIENDASAAALGEHRFGAGRGTRHLLHATLGTGIGGGIVIDGKLYRGAKGFAGEIGHIVVDPAGPRCNCGSRGCLEAVVSGVAFAERAKRLIEANTSPVLKELTNYRDPTAADLHTAATKGDRMSEAEIRHGGHVLGIALGSLVNVLNPEMVTLSGGLLQMGDMLLDPLREAMFSIAYGPASGTVLRTTELDENAGLLGAAAVAFEHLGA